MKTVKQKTELISFHCGTNGMEKHSNFINSIDKKGIKIINCYTKYNRFKEHMPDYLYYVIQYNEVIEATIFERFYNFVNKICRI